MRNHKLIQQKKKIHSNCEKIKWEQNQIPANVTSERKRSKKKGKLTNNNKKKLLDMIFDILSTKKASTKTETKTEKNNKKKIYENIGEFRSNKTSCIKRKTKTPKCAFKNNSPDWKFPGELITTETEDDPAPNRLKGINRNKNKPANRIKKKQNKTVEKNTKKCKVK